MASIAMTKDVALLVGTFAEGVENRSLLLDKFIFHKSWPVLEDERGGRVKWDDASRWSFIRLADDASTVLKTEASKLRRDAEGRNLGPANRERKLAQAGIAAQLARIAPPDPEISELRARHTRRFLALFQQQPERGTFLVGRLEGRLAINLAGGLVQNANLCLDRLLGVPHIPGSAVKGVCRHAALEELRASAGEVRRRLFSRILMVFGAAKSDFEPARKGKGKADKPAGDFFPWLDLTPEGKPLDRKGAISFLPAWPIDAVRILVDLTNVHTPAYYGGDRRAKIQAGSADGLASERPQVNPFPVVESGARFAFPVVLVRQESDPEILSATEHWLREALTVRGVGAKTGAGYGWFSVDEAAPAQIAASIKADEEKAAEAASLLAEAEASRVEESDLARAEEERIAALSPEDRDMEALLGLSDQAFAEEVKKLSTASEVRQRACVRLLREQKAKRERWKMWCKNGKKDLIAPVLEVVATFGLPPLP
ncbi:MAG: type III-B CRISPR module RAMP protein Cmr6 [Verrucomicrobiales bacterium]|nr:type III-B CRISPR module RAMP protein Cmr6 [Verrucomicrobiae bacterium]